ncbi:FAD-dependent oxidoreductase [Saccharopolyspora rosea]|uniref:FAD-dependent oxidoreductase n=1 Tax=Saccharopolyspora rosea TaxID=524884 RepID=A0ABW3FRR5_9PSEU|nr:FAD-dependent oxidoreductase [Saccharopolyspora rosea]
MRAADWDESYDVVVVGSGAGALTGAYAAAAAGLRTAVLEKTAVLGGTSAYSGSACWLPGTDVQRRAGVDDSADAARDYLRALLGEDTADRQEAFVATAAELVALLESDPAIEFGWQPFPDYFAAPGRVPGGRSFMPLDLPAEQLGERAALVRPPVERDRCGLGHPPGPLTGGRALIGRLLLACTGTGRCEIRTGTAVDRLVVEDGRVVGVRAGERRFAARRGVLLASGGYERNAALRDRHGVPGSAAWSMAPAETNSGEPLDAATAIGAATDLHGEAWWCPGLAQPDGGGAFTLGLRGGFIVDADGRRFANESLPYDRMGRALAAARLPAHLVFDARSRGRLPAIAIPDVPAEQHLAAGTWQRAESLTELAALIGVPADALSATAARFNAFAAEGVDHDFHRGEDEYDRFFAAGDGPNPCLVPVDRPPFYAARVVLGDLGTKGGLRTDTAGRVLREDGSAITGLYATGNTSASLTGAVYPGPGVPIGTAMVFGYRAARDMAGL